MSALPSSPPSGIAMVMILAVIALAVGGIYTLVRLRDRTKGLLMLTAAAVFLANVLILWLPV